MKENDLTAKIAVVMPNFNDAQYLTEALGSLLDQEVRPDEIVVVDDCSTDDSVRVIRRFIETEPRAMLVQNSENLGAIGAIWEGLKHARSEYVLLVASNDAVLPGIFARAKACLARHPGIGIWSAMTWIIDEQSRPVRLHASPVLALFDRAFSATECARLAMRHGNWFGGPTMIYHRETLVGIGGFDAANRGLSDMLAALIVAVRRGAVFSPEPLGMLRLHAGSVLSDSLADADWIEAMIELLRRTGPRIEPRIYTPEFLERLAARTRFAALRRSRGLGLAKIEARASGWQRTALTVVDRFVPDRLGTTRVALAFAILRAFDLLPTVWNRVLGTAWVLARTSLRGRGKAWLRARESRV